MDIEATKLELIHLLLQTKKKSVLAKLKIVFEEENTDWWGNLGEEEKDEIREGIKQADRGELIENTDVMEQFKKWH